MTDIVTSPAWPTGDPSMSLPGSEAPCGRAGGQPSANQELQRWVREDWQRQADLAEAAYWIKFGPAIVSRVSGRDACLTPWSAGGPPPPSTPAGQNVLGPPPAAVGRPGRWPANLAPLAVSAVLTGILACLAARGWPGALPAAVLATGAAGLLLVWRGMGNAASRCASASGAAPPVLPRGEIS